MTELNINADHENLDSVPSDTSHLLNPINSRIVRFGSEKQCNYLRIHLHCNLMDLEINYAKNP